MPSRPRINSHRLPRGGGRCDFCGINAVVKLYACHNFSWEGQRVFEGDTGRWATCFLCCELIEDSKWVRLSNRVMREVVKRKGITDNQLKTLRRTLLALHKAFGRHVIQGEAFSIHTPRFRVTAGG